MMFIRLRILTLLLALEVVHDGTCVQICEKYPSPDPCQPGGVWDPVLNRSSHVTNLSASLEVVK